MDVSTAKENKFAGIEFSSSVPFLLCDDDGNVIASFGSFESKIGLCRIKHIGVCVAPCEADNLANFLSDHKSLCRSFLPFDKAPDTAILLQRATFFSQKFLIASFCEDRAEIYNEKSKLFELLPSSIIRIAETLVEICLSEITMRADEQNSRRQKIPQELLPSEMLFECAAILAENGEKISKINLGKICPLPIKTAVTPNAAMRIFASILLAVSSLTDELTVDTAVEEAAAKATIEFHGQNKRFTSSEFFKTEMYSLTDTNPYESLHLAAADVQAAMYGCRITLECAKTDVNTSEIKLTLTLPTAVSADTFLRYTTSPSIRSTIKQYLEIIKKITENP